jgi:hypothetical protein
MTIAVSGRQREAIIPYRRGGFALTPPSVFIFLISLALALVAMLVRYMHAPVPIINASHVFDLLAIAYVVLTIGVVFRRV